MLLLVLLLVSLLKLLAWISKFFFTFFFPCRYCLLDHIPYLGGQLLWMLILIWFGSMKGHCFKVTCISVGSSWLLIFAWRGVRAKEDSKNFGNQLWHINYCWNEDTSPEYKTQKKTEWDWGRNEVILCNEDLMTLSDTTVFCSHFSNCFSEISSNFCYELSPRVSL